MQSVEEGYDEAAEDRLIAQCGWPDRPAGLYAISGVWRIVACGLPRRDHGKQCVLRAALGADAVARSILMVVMMSVLNGSIATRSARCQLRQGSFTGAKPRIINAQQLPRDDLFVT